MGNKQEKNDRGRKPTRERKERKGLRLSRSMGDIEDITTRSMVGFLSPQRILRTSPRSPRYSEVEINWKKVIDSTNVTTTIVEGNMDAKQRKPVVIKIIHDITDNPERKAMAEREFDIASGLECKNIVEYIDIRLQNDNYYITMEQCDMDLHDLLMERRKPAEDADFEVVDPAELLQPKALVDRIERESYHFYPLTEAELKHVALDVLTALDYLHHAGIMHLDVKLPNILVKNGPPITSATVFKLCDFGLAKYKSEAVRCENYGGTVEYSPPEVLCKKIMIPSEKHDIWSLGVCLFVCAAMMMPIGVEYGRNDVIQNPEQVRYDIEHIPLSMLDDLSDPAYDFISYCLTPNPKLRPKARWLLGTSQWLHEDPLITYASVTKKD